MMQTGKNLLSLLFSTNLENVYVTLTKNTGLKAVNAAPLMSLAASSVLAAFEKQSQQTNLSLASIIAQQDNSYFSHLPEEAAKTNFTQESTSIEPPPAQNFNKKIHEFQLVVVITTLHFAGQCLLVSNTPYASCR
ncbi:hypothetical protein REG_1595 [Candidatus Regiella insecticola LSR1]|uniref:Uncharacterized protein n=1 Tax=Candidatus Regiella insecticola LSR1 TaxID=663321 RepID=E0WU48_9ENTR|nr:hypothetical protein REG_1595 [Candidatus Regiella insecticola LSR1]